MKNPIAFALLLLGAVSMHANAQQAIDVNSLSETQVVVSDVSKPAIPGKSFLAATIINAPMQKLCSIIQDYSDYPNFMPNTDKTQILYAAEDHAIVNMILKLPLGKVKKYRLRLEPQTSPQACQLSWKLIPWEELKTEETITDTSGYWQLAPYPANSNKTVVKYFVYADPGPVPYGLGWIVDLMSKHSLPKTLEAVRERAQTR